MNNLSSIIIALFCIVCASCHTFTFSNGKKYRQAFPTKDKSSLSTLDTSLFTWQQFQLSHYTEKQGKLNNKRIITPLYGSDLKKLPAKGKYYIYFWNPTCVAGTVHMKILDSLSKQGENVIILSLRNEYELLNRKLSRTSFAQYPICIISGERSSNILLQRQVNFVKEGCSYCYEQYKDDLIFAQYLVVENDSVKVVFDTSAESILR